MNEKIQKILNELTIAEKRLADLETQKNPLSKEVTELHKLKAEMNEVMEGYVSSNKEIVAQKAKIEKLEGEIDTLERRKRFEDRQEGRQKEKVKEAQQQVTQISEKELLEKVSQENIEYNVILNNIDKLPIIADSERATIVSGLIKMLAKEAKLVPLVSAVKTAEENYRNANFITRSSKEAAFKKSVNDLRVAYIATLHQKFALTDLEKEVKGKEKIQEKREDLVKEIAGLKEELKEEKENIENSDENSRQAFLVEKMGSEKLNRIEELENKQDRRNIDMLALDLAIDPLKDQIKTLEGKLAKEVAKEEERKAQEEEKARERAERAVVLEKQQRERSEEKARKYAHLVQVIKSNQGKVKQVILGQTSAVLLGRLFDKDGRERLVGEKDFDLLVHTFKQGMNATGNNKEILKTTVIENLFKKADEALFDEEGELKPEIIEAIGENNLAILLGVNDSELSNVERAQAKERIHSALRFGFVEASIMDLVGSTDKDDNISEEEKAKYATTGALLLNAALREHPKARAYVSLEESSKRAAETRVAEKKNSEPGIFSQAVSAVSNAAQTVANVVTGTSDKGKEKIEDEEEITSDREAGDEEVIQEIPRYAFAEDKNDSDGVRLVKRVGAALSSKNSQRAVDALAALGAHLYNDHMTPKQQQKCIEEISNHFKKLSIFIPPEDREISLAMLVGIERAAIPKNQNEERASYHKNKAEESINMGIRGFVSLLKKEGQTIYEDYLTKKEEDKKVKVDIRDIEESVENTILAGEKLNTMYVQLDKVIKVLEDNDANISNDDKDKKAVSEAIRGFTSIKEEMENTLFVNPAISSNDLNYFTRAFDFANEKYIQNPIANRQVKHSFWKTVSDIFTKLGNYLSGMKTGRTVLKEAKEAVQPTLSAKEVQKEFRNKSGNEPEIRSEPNPDESPSNQ